MPSGHRYLLLPFLEQDVRPDIVLVKRHQFYKLPCSFIPQSLNVVLPLLQFDVFALLLKVARLDLVVHG